MRCAVVDRTTKKVVNVIEADPDKDSLPDADLIPNEIVSPGWDWDGEKFIDPTPPREPPPIRPPRMITRRQCALRLHTMGMISVSEAKAMTKDGTPPSAIQSFFDQMPAEQKDLAEIDFAAVNYYRDNPLITALMAANGLTETEIDNFFIAAAQL